MSALVRAARGRDGRLARPKTRPRQRNPQLEFDARRVFGTLATSARMTDRMNPPARPPRVEVQPGLWFDARRAVWLAAERILAIADPHWGYAASHRARGNLLPCWGDDDIESTLRQLVAEYAPAEMVWLGDIVHAAEGAARVERFLAAPPVPTTVLAGNHDRRWRGASERVLVRGAFVFHHGDQPIPLPPGAREMVGHHHPALAWGDGAGARVKLPALVVSPTRVVLPAFSPWAAGTPWRAQPGEVLWAASATRIFPFRQPAATDAVHLA